MLENLKCISLNKKDLKLINMIEPYWIKKINEKISKLNKWKRKFNDIDDVVLKKFEPYNDISDNIFQLNRFIVFLEKKYSVISNEFYVYKKFNKIFSTFIYIYANFNLFEIIIDFYKTIDCDVIGKKSEFLISLINQKINEQWNILNNKYINFLKKDDEYYNIVCQGILNIKNKIIDYTIPVTKLNKYISQINKKNDNKSEVKKITEEIAILSFELIHYSYSLSVVCNQFLLSVVD